MTHGFELVVSPVPLHTGTSPTSDHRQLARGVLQLARGHALLAFRLIGSQLHVLVACSRTRAERLLHCLQNRFACAHEVHGAAKNAGLIPITSHGALRDTFHRLMKGTPASIHEVNRHHDASNLPDLVGLRVTGDYTRLNVRALLPQVHGPELMAYLDMPGLLPPATAALWNSLPDAAAAAFALPAIGTRNDAGTRARTAAVHTARRHLSVTRMSQLMHIRGRTVRRLGDAKVQPDDVRAVRMQLTLRNIRNAQNESLRCSLAVAT